MLNINIPPIPPDKKIEDSYIWREWFSRLSQYLNTVIGTVNTNSSGTLTTVLKGDGVGGVEEALNVDLPTMTATVGGAVPTPPNNTTTFLRGDGTFSNASEFVSGGIISSNTTLNLTDLCKSYVVTTAAIVTLPTGVPTTRTGLKFYGGGGACTIKAPGTMNMQYPNGTIVLAGVVPLPVNSVITFISDGTSWFVEWINQVADYTPGAPITVNTTLDINNIGTYYIVTGAGKTITLPTGTPSSAVGFKFLGGNATPSTIKAPGSMNMAYPNGTLTVGGTYSLPAGAFVTVTSDGTSWFIEWTNQAVTTVTGTSPVVSSGGSTPAISMGAASSGVNGYMTGTYATKLDGIAAGATNVTNNNQISNGSGYITGITSGNVTTALGYTPADPTFPGWNTPTLANSWVDGGGGEVAFGYYKDSMGVVYFRGAVKSGTLGVTILNTALSAAYRPASGSRTFVTFCNATPSAALIQIATDGNIYIAGPANTVVGFNGVFYTTN
ncbi:hypothetical protein UFOVP1590_4 [uncultured Caudovirales phage]|uniref:Uncharacterized protein n=1 Tax=uncultured Caudovirales phage TaxID=2100421 RepID=A0A6J5SQI1_9CAUD|nr:hypothetical protein UFOVP1590_4 [uncultured Caudovirales phage]